MMRFAKPLLISFFMIAYVGCKEEEIPNEYPEYIILQPLSGQEFEVSDERILVGETVATLELRKNELTCQ